MSRKNWVMVKDNEWVNLDHVGTITIDEHDETVEGGMVDTGMGSYMTHKNVRAGHAVIFRNQNREYIASSEPFETEAAAEAWVSKDILRKVE